MRRVSIVLSAVLLAGCAVGKDPALDQYEGLTFQASSSGQEYITGAQFKYPGEPPKSVDALPLCLARVVNAYPATAQAVRFMAEDKRRAVAEGGVMVYESILGTTTETLVRYALDVSIRPDERIYEFDKLDQMLMGSPSMGFIRIGAWEGGSGAKIVEALQGVARSIDGCMYQ